MYHNVYLRKELFFEISSEIMVMDFEIMGESTLRKTVNF